MLKQPKQVVIDEITYTIGHWTVDKSTENLAWILETFGPTFRSVFEASEKAKTAKSDAELGLFFLEAVTTALPKQLPAKEYAQKCKELTEGVLADNSPIIYNNHFTGRILHLHKVISEVLKFQYADFLDVALGSSN